MAYIQKSTPPPNKILPFTLNVFNGGLNNRSTLLQANEASDVLNMVFYDNTIMEKRKGSKVFGAVTLPEAVSLLDEYKPYNDTDKFVRAGKTKFYLDNAQVATLTDGMDATNFQGKYFFVDGSTLRVYGKFPQSTTTYERVSGTPTSAYKVMTVVSCPTTYTALDTTHKRGVTVYDYANSKVWYEPCQNEFNDPYLGASVLPEKPRFIANHKGRMYLSGSDKDNDNVFLTQVGNPYYFAVSLPLQVPPNSDKVVGLAVYDNTVVVGRENDIHVIDGVTNNPDLGFDMFSVRKLNSHTGFASNQSVSVAHNYLFFLGNDGNAYALSSTGTDEKTLSTSLLTNTVDLKMNPFGFTSADFKTATAHFHNDLWYVSIKGFILIYSYRHRAWTVWDNLNARSFYTYQGKLLWGNEAGQTVEHSEDFLDQGKPYIAYWYSMAFDNGDASSYKQYRDFYILAHTFPEVNSDIRVTFEVDYADVTGETVVQNQLAVWGKTKFGERFINRNINASLPFTIGRRARSIRVRLVNGYALRSTVVSYVDLDAIVGKEEGYLAYVSGENKYYVYKIATTSWVEVPITSLNQAMRVYQVHGEYELRGKR